jgi:hypothetical protein
MLLYTASVVVVALPTSEFPEGPMNYSVHYVTLHSLVPKLGKLTVGSGICHINTNIYIYSTTEVFICENTVITHEAIQKYIRQHNL